MFSQELSAVSGQRSAVSQRPRYGNAGRTVAPSVAHRLIADH
ncbi:MULTISPECIES: hypothetical protein [Moorena]|nr:MULTISPECIES: hypothetical protein [Moorena]